MKLLITSAAKLTKSQIIKLSEIGYDIDFCDDLSPLKQSRPEKYDAVVCNAFFMKNDIEQFKSLKYVQLTSVGYDRFPIEKAKKLNIKINNVGNIFSNPIAEFVLLFLLSHYKRYEFFLENNNSKKWNKKRNLDELCKKNIYILGCGNIGKSIASKLIPFECNITGFDLFEDFNNTFPIKTISSLMNSLPKADAVIICLPLNQQTYHYVDINFLSKMKKNGLLINVSRGAIIDTACLINFLNEHKAFTAYLDVFEEEPLKPSSPLWNLDNLKITPHNTFVSKNNKRKLFEHYYRFLKQLKA